MEELVPGLETLCIKQKRLYNTYIYQNNEVKGTLKNTESRPTKLAIKKSQSSIT